MRTRRTVVVGVVALAVVSIGALLAPQTVGAVITAFSILVFFIALIGLSRPEWVRLPNRAASVWVWVGVLVRLADRRLDADGAA